MRQSRTLKLMALVAVITMLLGGTALADVVTNTVSTTTAGGVLTVQAGSSATVYYNVKNTNSTNPPDPQKSCNPADTSPLTISVTGLPTGVTAGSAAVSACGDNVGQITFQVGSGVTPREYSLVHNFADSGVGTYQNLADFTLTVTAPADSTPPVINPTISGTEGDNGWYTSDVSLSWDVSDNQSAISSSTGCGVTSITADQGATVYTCSATSAGGTHSESVTIKRDATPPQVAYTSPPSGTAGDNGWYTSDVTATFTATDGLSGFASGRTQTGTATTSGEGANRTVGSPAFTDLAGNTAPAGSPTSPAFKVDKSDPTNVTFVGGPSDGASYYFGAVPGAPTCTAEDAVSGLASCLVTGHNTGVGSHTLTATATDNAGRRSTATLSYTVGAWNTKGFYSPVDMGGVLNSVKGGSTVPLKFEVFAGVAPAGELTTTTAIGASIKYAKISCDGSAPVDEIETLASGSTALRFDDTSGQFVYNWKTPTGAGCYRVTVSLADGSSIWANFKTR